MLMNGRGISSKLGLKWGRLSGVSPSSSSCFSSSSFRSPYDDLGVSPQASTDQIREAYIKLSKIHHPDVKMKGEDLDLAVRDENDEFLKIREAYRILSNPKLRRKLDRGAQLKDLEKDDERIKKDAHEFEGEAFFDSYQKLKKTYGSQGPTVPSDQFVSSVKTSHFDTIKRGRNSFIASKSFLKQEDHVKTFAHVAKEDHEFFRPMLPTVLTGTFIALSLFLVINFG